jgi:hypothetical protein
VNEEPAETLPPELKSWLAALARAVQRYGLYPPGHPALGDLAGELHEGLAPLLAELGELQFTVAPDRLLFGESWIEGGSQLPGLARRLHEHDLAAFGFQPGASASELGSLLTALREIPATDEDRLGRRAGMASRWPNVWIEPREYDRLSLDEAPSGGSLEDRDRRAARLWLGLAGAAGALPETLDPASLEDADRATVMAAARTVAPDDVAERIRGLGEEDAMKSVGASFLEIAHELEHPDGEFDLRDRFTGVLQTFDRPDVQRVLERGLGSRDRRRLIESTTSWLPSNILVNLVETTSDLGDIDVSHWMLRILVKLSGQARTEDALSSEEADVALRDQVKRAITGWSAEPQSGDPEYAEALRMMSDPAQGDGQLPLVDTEHAPEALHMLQMAAEVDVLGRPGEQALARLLEADRLSEIVEVADAAPAESTVAPVIWSRLARPEVVRALLGRSPPEFDALGKLAPRIPEIVARPLLDLLAESPDRSVRGKAYSILTALGEDVGAQVVARLEDDRWFVQRNMLALLFEIGAPESFSARPFTRHENSQVRREAYKHLLRDPETRPEAIHMCAQESDPRTIGLGLTALEGAEALEPELVPLLAGHAADSELPPELRLMATRALALSDAPRARRALLGLCLRRHPILFWRRQLKPDSPVVREAVSGLARRWTDDPAVRRVLESSTARRWLEPGERSAP